MRHNKENEEPHEPEMPYPRYVKAYKERGQPMELHRFMNPPACGDRKKPGNRHGKVRCTLQRVVFCVETGMQPFAVCEFSEGDAEVVLEHLERIKQVRPARQQPTPSSSQGQPRNVNHAVQHEQVSTQPMQTQRRR